MSHEKKAARRARDSRHLARLAEVNERLKDLKAGATRREVERLFQQRNGGLQGSNSTTYYEDPEVLISVTYDATGGAWSPDNRVLDSPSVRRGSATMD